MRVPMILRLEVAFAVLTGRFRQISVSMNREEGATYQILLGRDSLKRWLRRREERRAKTKGAEG